ncbi:hypothetical protein ACH5RR_007177 [Cinchona calisaya]|uniref:Pentatricopeptide repeat-containing protein n=1 Tax=Cinchona calisaya TaxID=153742 RepID=A0ABD3AR28_9GENT
MEHYKSQLQVSCLLHGFTFSHLQCGENPNIVTYNALMDGYCLRGQMHEARNGFDTMVSSCLQPSTVSYGILLNGYFKRNNLDKALHIFGELQQRGFKPNTSIYNRVLKGLFRVEK